MKKIFILALGLSVLIGCKKESTDNGGGNGSGVWPDYLIGTWDLDDVEMQMKVTVSGIPIVIDGESITTNGGYTFNSDNTFSFDWESDMALAIPLLGPDTMLIEQDGAGTYLILNENQIELDQNGTKTVLDLKSKSPSLIITEFEDTMMYDTLSVDVDVEAILSK